VVVQIPVDEAYRRACGYCDSIWVVGEQLYLYYHRYYAVRVERVGHYLGELPPGGCGSWSKVGAVGGRVARLTWTSTRIATHYIRSVQQETLYEYMEGALLLHVLEGLSAHLYLVVEARGIGHYLGYLTTSSVGRRAEIGAVARRHTRLAWTSAVVPLHHPIHAEPLDEEPECAARRHILIGLYVAWGVVEGSGVRDNLGYLAPCDEVTRAEVGVAVSVTRLTGSTAGVAGDEALAGEALDEGVEGTPLGHVGELEGARGRGGEDGGRGRDCCGGLGWG